MLCAGAIGSAQLLQCSGIGDPEVLAGVGIEVVHALPGVGRNLQDHLQVRNAYRIRRPITINDMTRGPLRQLVVGMDYVFRRRGVLSFGASLAGAFVRSATHLDWPDIQLHFQPLSTDKYEEGLHAFSGITISACQLRPESRGELFVRTPSMLDAPSIAPNYLSAEIDREAMIAGLKYAADRGGAGARRSRGKRNPAPDGTAERGHPRLHTSDSVINLSSIWHLHDGARDLRRGRRAVACPRVEGRVADCSSCRLSFRQHHAAAIMIGEKAAAMVDEDAVAARRQ